MRPRCIAGLPFVAIAAMVSCAAHPLDDAAWPPPRPLGESLQTSRPDDPDAGAPDVAQPTGELALRQAMALAVAHHPRLTAFAMDVRRAEAQALQAGLWSNPELDVEFENFAGTDAYSGTQALETTVSLAQTFPLGGDLDRRRELATHEAQLAGWDYEAARLAVLTEVTQRYVALVAAQRRVAVMRESLALAEQVDATTAKRIDAGAAPAIERARSGVAIATAGIDLRRAERAQELARLQLAATWGSHAPTFTLAIGSLDDMTPPPPPSSLASLITDNPDVARWATQISAHEAERRLAEASAVPDLTGRIGYRHDRGEDASSLVVGVSLPLPIFDRAQGDALAARWGVAAAHERRRDAELRLGAMLSEAYTRLAGAYDEAVALRDDALSPAAEAFDVTRRAFEQGDVAFIDVIDAERILVELRTRYLDALTDYHLAAAEVEGLIGRPLDALEERAAP